MASEQSPLVAQSDAGTCYIDNAVIAAWQPSPLAPNSLLHGSFLCSSPAVPWRQRRVVIATCLAWCAGAMAVFTSVYTQQYYSCIGAPSSWQRPERGTVASTFHLCDERGEKKLALLGSLLFVGGGIGVLVAGKLSDTIGRHKTTMFMLTLMVLGLVVCAISPNYALYACGRVLCGIGALGMGPPSFACALEWIPPAWRVPVGVGFIEIAYMCGEFVDIGLALLFNGWRQFTWATAIACLILTIATSLLMRESPSWLHAQPGMQEWALELLGNPEDLPKEQASIAERQVAVQPPVKDANIVYIRVATWAAAFCWFTCAVSYFGISLGISNLGGSVYASSAYAAIIEGPANVFAAFLMDRHDIGRRSAHCFLFLCGGFSCLLMTLVASDYSGRVAVMMCGKFCLSAAFAGIIGFTSELYLPATRGQGLAICSFMCRVGAIIAPFISGGTSTTTTYITFGTLSIFASVVCRTLMPETVCHAVAKEGADKA